MQQEPLHDLTRPSRRSLNVIVILHLLESVAQVVALLLITRWLDLDLDVGPLWVLVAAYGIWNLGTLALLLTGGLDPAGSRAVFIQLLAEVAVLTALLYFSGGSSNPFVSLYLVPVALCATILGLRYTVALAVASIGAYSALMVWNVPLAALQVGHVHNGWNLHIGGMWVNFIVSTLVVVVFLSLLVRQSRVRAEELARLREQAIRNEQVVTIGSIAATAAHSISTPLSTVGLLLDDLAEEMSDAERRESVDLARQQIEYCRGHLTDLLAAGGVRRLSEARRETVRNFLDGLLSQWLTTRPEARLQRRLDPSLDGWSAVLDPTLRNSIVNLLDNAADANSEAGEDEVHFSAAMQGSVLEVLIDDKGHGPPPDPGAVEFASTKAGGHGVGLLLARVNIARMGGAIRLEGRAPGCRVVVTLPLTAVERGQG
ncbi:MAG: ATP-binding protein [Gammaproteobacteria bacterium]